MVEIEVAEVTEGESRRASMLESISSEAKLSDNSVSGDSEPQV